MKILQHFHYIIPQEIALILFEVDSLSNMFNKLNYSKLEPDHRKQSSLF
jgi:hypothetical protein